MDRKKKILLIDANSLIHRSFHALPELTNRAGFPTGALYGFINMLLKILEKEKPDYVAAAFDRPEPTFRKKLASSYKAHRPKAPDALILQIKKAREVLRALRINSFEAAGFEADDIIGTLAEKFKNETNVRILTGDLDSLQLVEDGRVTVITLRKGVTDIVEYDEVAVLQRFGVPPKSLIDYKALVGDTSDNISGVPGIGNVGAAKLVSEYGKVEDILRSKDQKNPLVRKVKEHKEEALLSKTLAEIKRDVPLETNLKDLARENISEGELSPMLHELEFQSLIKRFGIKEKKSKEKKEPSSLEFSPTLFPTYEGENTIYFLKSEELEKRLDDLNQFGIKVGYDLKSIYKECVRKGKKISFDASFFDVILMGWLLYPDAKEYSLDSLYGREFKRDFPGELQALRELFEAYREKMGVEGLQKIFKEIEMPLIPILGDMELLGIGVNLGKLQKLKGRVKKETDVLAKKIWGLAGEKFNLNSPKQLSSILFEKLSVTGGKRKKTKTGVLSTREGVLEELKDKHPIIPLMMEHRENTKVLGTYVEPLLELQESGRVHTTFLQTGTVTGRLSSEKPNLQNIPQEGKWASELRDCFEAKRGCSLLAFDYSQLELRILAHLSGDPDLTRAFHEGRDIHTTTAQKIFGGVEIDHAKRRMAKVLNFGVVYGMGARGFSRSAGVTLAEAKRYIQEYFSEFPKVRSWQETQKRHAKRFGWVANENGRKRWFSSFKNFSEVERAAINMPTQSVGADIMKIALIHVSSFLKEKGFGSKVNIVLTVHDELIVEVEDDILKEIAREVRNIMESCYSLSVPLKVDVKRGKTLGSLSVMY